MSDGGFEQGQIFGFEQRFQERCQFGSGSAAEIVVCGAPAEPQCRDSVHRRLAQRVASRFVAVYSRKKGGEIRIEPHLLRRVVSLRERLLIYLHQRRLRVLDHQVSSTVREMALMPAKRALGALALAGHKAHLNIPSEGGISGSGVASPKLRRAPQVSRR